MIVFIAEILLVIKALGGCYKRNVISGLQLHVTIPRLTLGRRKLISRISNDVYMKKRRAFCNLIS